MIHTRLSVSTKYRDPCAIIVSGIIKRKNKSYTSVWLYFFIVDRKLNRKIDIYYIDDWNIPIIYTYYYYNFIKRRELI